MTNIIELAKKAGLELDLFNDNFSVLHGKLITLEQLIRADEREACVKVCLETITRPPGYSGQWEGYGPVNTQLNGDECAAAIRARGTT